MFVVSETEAGRVLTKVLDCRKVVRADGEIVKFGKRKSILFPKDTVISVSKINSWEMHSVRMVKNRQVLSDNSTITEKELSGNMAEMLEEEILLSSLEVLEIL